MTDFRTLLPSQLRAELTRQIFDKIKNAGVDWRSKPRYNMVDAFRDFGIDDDYVQDDYVQKILPDCFQAAMERFDGEYPLCWDNENQRSYRKGL